MNEWWTMQQAGIIGAIGGSAVGVLGGLFGSVVGFCAPRGIARVPILGAQAALATVGLLLLCAGLWALLGASQPRHVVLPLCLAGFLSAVVFGGLLPIVAARYREAEVRRMHAQDLRRG